LLIAVAGVLAGGWIALGAFAVPKLLLFAALSGLGLGMAGNVANDVQDVAADRVNPSEHRHPMAAGRIRPDTAYLLIWIGIAVGLGGAALVSGRQVVVAALALAAMLVYSALFKRYGLPGNLAVAVVGGLPLFYGALAVGRPAAGIVPWVLAAWLHLARELVKDLEDEAGDRAAGRRTLPVRLGLAAAARIAGWVCLAFLPLALVLPLATGYGLLYIALAATALVVMLLAVRYLRGRRFMAASMLLKVTMVIGLGALVLGRVA
jgi:4-hydroxybenzoate polyprenyltransferase